MLGVAETASDKEIRIPRSPPSTCSLPWWRSPGARVLPVLERSGVAPLAVRNRAEEALSKLPWAHGGAAIVGIQLGYLRQRLAERRLALEVTPDAALWLANAGYDEAYGARPVKRLLQREIADRLALALLEGRHGEANWVVKVDVEDGHIMLR